MPDFLQFLINYGEIVVFAVVFLEQAGLPLPSSIFLVAAGGLAGTGLLNGPVIMVLAIIATMAANLIWFQLGRWQGTRILGLLCKISMEPDACKRITERIFARHGLPSLLVVKFIPGLSAIASPMAGITGVKLLPFFIFNLAGTLIWVGTLEGLGIIFSDELENITGYLASWGLAVGGAIIALFIAYIGFKFLLRAIFIRRLRMARVTAGELREMMDAGDKPLVVDLRHPLDVDNFPYQIPGAKLLSPTDFGPPTPEFLLGREVILYCS